MVAMDWTEFYFLSVVSSESISLYFLFGSHIGFQLLPLATWRFHFLCALGFIYEILYFLYIYIYICCCPLATSNFSP